MKKKLGICLFVMFANIGHAQTYVQLRVGETKVIEKYQVNCEASPADKVCKLKQRYQGSNYNDATYLTAIGFTRNGEISTKTEVELGEFATRAEAMTRMKELQAKGYCL